MKHLFRDTIIVYPNATKDAFGRDNDSAGVAYRGRAVIETTMVIKRVLGQAGIDKEEETQADATFYLPVECNIEIGEKVEYKSTKYRVMTLKRVKDDISEKFIKIQCKKVYE